MSHTIRAIIGKADTVGKLSTSWLDANTVEIGQGFALLKIHDELLDAINELINTQGEDPFPEFRYLSASLHTLLIHHSFRDQLTYIETDYFGGTGSQAAILYENGKIKTAPQLTQDVWDENTRTHSQIPQGTRAINHVLKFMGVWCKPGKDEFAMLGLDQHRKM